MAVRSDCKQDDLDDGPKHDPLVGSLARLPEPSLPVPLVVLLLLDLIQLVKQLPDAKLQLSELLLLGNLLVVHRLLSDLDVEVHSDLAAGEKGPAGGVGPDADVLLARGVGGEGEGSLRPVHLVQDDLAVRILDVDVHAHSWWRVNVVLGLLVVELGLVLSGDHDVLREFLNETFGFLLANVEVHTLGLME